MYHHQRLDHTTHLVEEYGCIPQLTPYILQLLDWHLTMLQAIQIYPKDFLVSVVTLVLAFLLGLGQDQEAQIHHSIHRRDSK